MIFKELHIYFTYNKEDKTATRTIKDDQGNIVYQCTSIIFSNAFENDPVRALEDYLSEYPNSEQSSIEKAKQWTFEDEMQLLKNGEKPLFIGFSLTPKQYDELIPYINDPIYLEMIQSRVVEE